jgi:hypothetical protein
LYLKKNATRPMVASLSSRMVLGGQCSERYAARAVSDWTSDQKEALGEGGARMSNSTQELVYTVRVEQVRPHDFVARALAFPNQLALGDTADEAIARVRSLLSYQVRDARAHGESVPPDVTQGCGEGHDCIAVTIAA